MNIKLTIATITFLLLSLALLGHTAIRDQHKASPYLTRKPAKTKPDPRTSVPSIARLLGVRVGYNGQKALIHRFGDGLHTVGGHPGGRKLWYTRKPSGYIETDGFCYNDEGLALESLYWSSF